MLELIKQKSKHHEQHDEAFFDFNPIDDIKGLPIMSDCFPPLQDKTLDLIEKHLADLRNERDEKK